MSNNIRAGLNSVNNFEELSGHLIAGFFAGVVVVVLLIFTFLLDKMCNTHLLDDLAHKKNKTWLYYLLKIMRVMTHTKYIVAETGKEIPIEEVVRLKNNRDFFQLGPISNAISG